MKTLSLQPPAHHAPPCCVLIGRGILENIPKLITEAEGIIVLHDARVEKIAKNVSALLGNAPCLSVASGEASKSMSEAERICAQLLKMKMSRRSVLITIGGGMLTDLGGFVASIYQRGIRVIHVPTTLLAMTDAAVGGKTAVDLGSAKNMIGTIHQPLGIVMDIATLEGLPQTAISEGMVEAVKMAAILDAESFEWMEKHTKDILKREDAALIETIERSVRMKAAVIEEDERESGKRMLLNFGHTVGHAVEALSNFSIPHGQAVSIGMVCEMMMAGTKGADRVTALLQSMEMPTDIPKEFTTEDLWDLMQSDKKSSGGVVRMAVPDRIGHGAVQAISKDLFARSRS